MEYTLRHKRSKKVIFTYGELCEDHEDCVSFTSTVNWQEIHIYQGIHPEFELYVYERNVEIPEIYIH